MMDRERHSSDECGNVHFAKLDAMPASVRQGLEEVAAAVEALNRDQAAAIAELAFERAAELRARAEGLRQRKAAILREWRPSEVANEVPPAATQETPRGLVGLFGKFRDDPTLREICEDAYKERDADRDEQDR